MDWRFLTLAAQYDFLNRKFFNYLVGRKGIIKMDSPESPFHKVKF